MLDLVGGGYAQHPHLYRHAQQIEGARGSGPSLWTLGDCLLGQSFAEIFEGGDARESFSGRIPLANETTEPLQILTMHGPNHTGYFRRQSTVFHA